MFLPWAPSSARVTLLFYSILVLPARCFEQFQPGPATAAPPVLAVPPSSAKKNMARYSRVNPSCSRGERQK
jgi:hypothetical protein